MTLLQRISPAFLILALLAFGLAGCNSSGSGSSEQTVTASGSTAAPLTGTATTGTSTTKTTSTATTGSTSTTTTTVAPAPATASGNAPTGIGLFLYMEKPDYNRGQSYAQRCKDFNIRFVNLQINWFDLEPSNNNYTISGLADCIRAFHDSNIAVVLRIYNNTSGMLQSTPTWVFDEAGAQPLWIGGVRVPVPTDSIFQREFGALLANMAQQLKAKNSIPEAVHVAMGGEYGEMIYPYSDVNAFISTTCARMIDLYANNLLPVINVPLFMSVNHLTHDMTPYNTLLAYAQGKGVRFAQTNCSSSKLQLCSYGPNNASLMQTIYKGYPKIQIALEDEEGASNISSSGCPYIAKESVATRAERIRQVESQYGMHFTSITLDIDDLTDANRDFIRQWSAQRPS